VLTIVASMAIPNYFSAVESARVAACVAEIRILSREIDLYQMMNNEYPASLADIKRDQTMDPWGRPYSYLNLKDVVDDHAEDHEHIPPGQSGDNGNGNGGSNGNGGGPPSSTGNDGGGGPDGSTGAGGSTGGGGGGAGASTGGGGGGGWRRWRWWRWWRRRWWRRWR
jgi:type II secretory pathway pseudopilin PulG